jgi:NADPH2:quinone reductase
MKAICVHAFGPPEVMRWETIPDPVAGEGQVLVRLLAAGVNPVDTYVRSGVYRPDLPLPYTPGADGAGCIEAIGAGVTRFQAGQRVYLTAPRTGAYAEKAVADEAHVFALPEAISFSEGAALGVPYGTAYRALADRARAQPGETVLVHGASGGVGLAAVQFARAAGLTVIGTAGSRRGMDLVLEQGAHHALNHKEPGYTAALLTLTGGRGVDVILEMLANVNLATDLTLLALHGRVVVIGSRGRIEIDPRDTMRRDATILGMGIYALPAPEMNRVHAAIRAGLEAGTLRPVVSREIPMAEAAIAHHGVMEQSTFGKLVLVP